MGSVRLFSVAIIMCTFMVVCMADVPSLLQSFWTEIDGGALQLNSPDQTIAAGAYVVQLYFDQPLFLINNNGPVQSNITLSLDAQAEFNCRPIKSKDSIMDANLRMKGNVM